MTKLFFQCEIDEKAITCTVNAKYYRVSRASQRKFEAVMKKTDYRGMADCEAVGVRPRPD